MSITAVVAEAAKNVIESMGYGGVFIGMTLESMVFPLPSEAVMPFAGFLIADGKFTWSGVLIASTLGSINGSLLSYAMGLWGGRPFLEKWGRWFLVNKSDLESTYKFFNKHGALTVFISRFVPVVRHLISIPAGMARMSLKTFIVYTAIGAFCWNGILTAAGFYLQKNWNTLMKYGHTVDLVVVSLLMLFVIYFIWRHMMPAKKK